MFGIGSTELLLILVVALVVLGPKSLAGFARSLGKLMGEFRRVSTEFQRTLNVETAQAEAPEEASRKSAATVKSSETSKTDNLGFPEDSPVAREIAKARAEAEKAESGMSSAAKADSAKEKNLGS